MKCLIKYIGLTAAVLFSLSCYHGWAQVTAANPDVVAALTIQTELQETNAARDWAEKIKEWLETKEFQGKSIENYVNQLTTQKLSLQTLKDGFKIASGFWSKASIVLDLYDAMDVIIDDVNRVKQEINYYKTYKPYSDGYGLNVVSPMSSTLDLVSRVSGDAYEVFSFVRDQVFNPDNSLTWEGRMDMAQKSLQRLKTHHHLYDAIISDLVRQKQSALDKEINALFEKRKREVTGYNDVLRGQIASSLAGSSADFSAIENYAEFIASGGKIKLSPASKSSTIRRTMQSSSDAETVAKVYGVDTDEGINVTGRSIANMVFVVISILAALFLMWNFWQLSHGDKQHMDALWKVGAGYIIMALFIQVFKAVFF